MEIFGKLKDIPKHTVKSVKDVGIESLLKDSGVVVVNGINPELVRRMYESGDNLYHSLGQIEERGENFTKERKKVYFRSLSNNSIVHRDYVSLRPFLVSGNDIVGPQIDLKKEFYRRVVDFFEDGSVREIISEDSRDLLVANYFHTFYEGKSKWMVAPHVDKVDTFFVRPVGEPLEIYQGLGIWRKVEILEDELIFVGRGVKHRVKSKLKNDRQSLNFYFVPDN